jgi:hypothetical protein
VGGPASLHPLLAQWAPKMPHSLKYRTSERFFLVQIPTKTQTFACYIPLLRRHHTKYTTFSKSEVFRSGFSLLRRKYKVVTSEYRS